jgi:hypothetical protein
VAGWRQRRTSSAGPPAEGRRRGATTAVAAGSVGAIGVLCGVGGPAVAQFVVGALSLTALAAVVGQQVRRPGGQWSERTTAVLQATVGNLPELCFGVFAL